MSASSVILACVVCFSALDPAARSGVNAGVLTLLGVTAAVLAGFAVFIARMARRAKVSGRLDGTP